MPYKAPLYFSSEMSFGDLSFVEFIEQYDQLNVGLDQSLEEQFRIYKRECFLSSACQPLARNLAAKEINQWDLDGTCPDSVAGSSWDYEENTDVIIDDRVIILDQSVNAGNLIIQNGGKLIFRDFGEDSEVIKLRAKSIKIHNNGEMWIGSRTCRYQGNADVILYGNREDMVEDVTAGTKYLWCSNDCVLEMHGKDKKSWTHLADHLFRNNIAADDLIFNQDKDTKQVNIIGNRLVFHAISAEGDLRDTASINNGETNFHNLTNWLEENHIDENSILFFTDFVYELTDDLKDILLGFGIDISGLMTTENNRKYSQIAGIFNTHGQSDFKSISPSDDGLFHFGLNAFVGPIDLTGEKSGFDFGFEVDNDWWFKSNNSTQFTVEQVQEFVNDNSTFTGAFRVHAKQQISYSSSTKGQLPIITLAENVNWNVGDEIVVASTSWDSRDSETFTIIECDSCGPNQVKLNRVADYTHWGRIDSRSGIDQRAEVGLLSRNVRFYGEMSSDTCQYAFTRESLKETSPNHGVSWCDYFKDVEGGIDRDMHGAHMITTGFQSFYSLTQKSEAVGLVYGDLFGFFR